MYGALQASFFNAWKQLWHKVSSEGQQKAQALPPTVLSVCWQLVRARQFPSFQLYCCLSHTLEGLDQLKGEKGREREIRVKEGGPSKTLGIQ